MFVLAWSYDLHMLLIGMDRGQGIRHFVNEDM
jgi:hypothetical protein